MFNNTGYSLSDIAAATGGNNRGNENGAWGDGAWWKSAKGKSRN